MFWIKFSQSGPGDFGDGMVWILKSLRNILRNVERFRTVFERVSNAFWTLSNGYAFFTQLDLNGNFQSERFFYVILRFFSIRFFHIFF